MEWMENLTDDELKNNEGLKKFQSIDDVVKSYVHLESLNGNSIRVPGPDASEDDRAKFYDKLQKAAPNLMLRPDPESPEQMKEYHALLGVPEDIDGYEFNGELSDEVLADLKAMALEAKMPRDVFDRWAKKMEEAQGFIQQTKEEARISQGAELKQEWGLAFEDRYAVVEKFAQEHPGLGDVGNMSPAQMKEYYSLAVSLTGKPQIAGQPESGGRLTPHEAKERLNEIRSNPKFISNNPADRFERQELLRKSIELMKLSDPAKYA